MRLFPMSRPPLRVLFALSLVGLTAFGCSSKDDPLDGEGPATVETPAAVTPAETETPAITTPEAVAPEADPEATAETTVADLAAPEQPETDAPAEPAETDPEMAEPAMTEPKLAAPATPVATVGEPAADPKTAEVAVPVDPALPDYARGEVVSGTITSKGSDTMRAVMDFWAEGFKQSHPAVKFELESKGSSSAPTALIEGTALVGVMSRPMKASEIQAFEEKFSYKPTELKTSRDLLAVFVNKDNPVKGLTLPQVDAIFSANRELGLPEQLKTWGQVGVKGPLANRPISLYGRNSASGTYGYFKEVALGDGDFSDSVKEQSGTSGAIQAVSDDNAGIAYSGIGGQTAGVRALPLGLDEGDDLFEPTVKNADSGDYPLARFLLIYVNKTPNKDVQPLTREFLKYVFSKQGQEKVVQAGYFPISATEAAAQLTAAGISTE